MKRWFEAPWFTKLGGYALVLASVVLVLLVVVMSKLMWRMPT